MEVTSFCGKASLWQGTVPQQQELKAQGPFCVVLRALHSSDNYRSSARQEPSNAQLHLLPDLTKKEVSKRKWAWKRMLPKETLGKETIFNLGRKEGRAEQNKEFDLSTKHWLRISSRKVQSPEVITVKSTHFPRDLHHLRKSRGGSLWCTSSV